MRPLGLGWPNVISILRMLLVPVLVVLILADGQAAAYAAGAVFIVGAVSDGVDGYLARRHAMTTPTGAWLDPLSDKLFVAAPIVLLTALGEFPLWAAVIIIAREASVQLLRVYLGSRRMSMPASGAAKAKTVAQLVAIALYLLPLSGSVAGNVRITALLIAVTLTIYSGVDYFVRARASGWRVSPG